MISRLATLVRRPPHPSPTPESLIINPVETATVARLANGRYHIQWQRQAETVTIYVNTKPCFDDTTQLWANVTSAQAVIVPPLLESSRSYFILEFGQNDRVITAERFLPMPNSLNFRDLGGYVGENGKIVRWGQVYRSGSLAYLDKADFAMWDALHLQTVFDLRSNHESQKAPDRLPPHSASQHLLRPMGSAGTRTELIKAVRQYRHRTGDLLLRLYQEVFIDENAHHIGDILTRISYSANRPALIHCSAGKDRTGITSALLLMVLGVPEETVVADYSLSNLAHTHIAELMAPELRQARWAAVGYAQMKPVLLANPAHLQATFAYIRHQYGSIEEYLCGAAGMMPETLDTLRQDLLT